MGLSYRILDAWLREDLFGVVSNARLEAPAGSTGQWLRSEPIPGEAWYLPVRRATQLQEWQSREDWLFVERGGELRRVAEPSELVELMLPLVDEPQALLEELQSTLEHESLIRPLRGAIAPVGPLWSDWLLSYDGVASLQDHPLYPLARAKVGLSDDDLRRYAPEFAPRFELRWLGVAPQSVQRLGELPAWWPTASQLGLPPGSFPVPVHPHTAVRLELPEEASWATESFLEVSPTLSVRTVALSQWPEFHLKLPLFMRSLSYKNLRKVKPDTLHDGAAVQNLLHSVLARHPELSQRVLLTDEGVGLSVDERADLACIVRRYPVEQLEGCRLLPTAALAAPLPDGSTVLESLGPAFAEEYARLTLHLHLTLWCLYGIALESNQQNTVVVVEPDGGVRLLLKDNDAARIYSEWTRTQVAVPEFRDPCLTVSDWESLASMFITITLQLNLQPFVPEQRLAALLEEVLNDLPAEAVRRSRVRELLVQAPHHPVKRLWSAGTLFSKGRTGAADINKYYGATAPNWLRENCLVPR